MKRIGRFNVYLYPECSIDGDGSKYHLLDLSEWDGDKQVKQNFLYVDDESFQSHYWDFEDEDFLAKLISKPRNSKIHVTVEIHISLSNNGPSNS